MNDFTLSALLTAIPPTLAGIAALIVSLRGNAEVRKVHTLVNSQKEALETKIRGLEAKLIDALKKV